MIKRRRFVQGLAAAPAIPALAQQPAVPNPPGAPPQGITFPGGQTFGGLGAPMEIPKLEVTSPDAVAETVRRFFTADQFAALEKLSSTLMPAIGTAPGALDAKAPEFLDFLLSESGAERQQLYRTGLDTLNAQARKRFSKTFSQLETAQVTELLAPLKRPWAYDPPTDPLERFLRAAKQDVRTATMNSREYAAAGPSAGGRGRVGGSGLYWYPLD
ncbi:MAG: gluconate 2-dehydrogenase subunit 3 family protein [Acidobacteria bacterium]|nr:gluconate 2-dehydrogenase subunit 3 family protein [Acidobacteriota bacterium]